LNPPWSVREANPSEADDGVAVVALLQDDASLCPYKAGGTAELQEIRRNSAGASSAGVETV
jgi:hypothetical protein